MTRPWDLSTLLAPWASVASAPEVKGVAQDSRAVTPGSLFLAVRGIREHGLRYLEQALDNGAVAVAWEPAPGVDVAAVEAACDRRGVPVTAIDALAENAGAIAARFHEEPARALRVVGVTGTDGKTSVTQFIAQALDGREQRCGVIGTLGWGFPGTLSASAHTTPDAVTLQRWLAELRDTGARSVAMEVSSHALDQARVAAVPFDVAVLTNLGRDHLDYHGSEAAYADAKRRLFTTGRPRAVLNVDDEFGRELFQRRSGDDAVTYSGEGVHGASLRCLQLELEPGGMRLGLAVGRRRATVRVPLIGRFNAANTLAALGALIALDVPLAEAIDRLSHLKPVPGRMECYRRTGGPAVIVDYAHTPGALQAALTAAREHFPGRVWVVFGCGGDRDRGKRPLMGAIARGNAERLVLTNDNPRGEEPERIIADIKAGAGDDDRMRVIPDRHDAIAYALSHAAPSDVVLVAGKGHEDYQIIGERRLSFSDRDVVSQLLRGIA